MNNVYQFPRKENKMAIIPILISYGASLLTRLLTGVVLDQVIVSIAKAAAARTASKADDQLVATIEKALKK